MTQRTRWGAVAAGAAAVLLVAGCTAPSLSRSAHTPAPGPTRGFIPGTIPPDLPSPPIVTGSTDTGAGKDADALLAQARRPPRTLQTATAPAPSLASPFSSFNCESAQRSVFWVASGWSLDDLSDWFRENTYNLTLEATGHGTTLGVVTSRSVTEGQFRSAMIRNLDALTMLLVPLGGNRIGVRVEAEATPSLPCSPSTPIPATPTPDAEGSTPRNALSDAHKLVDYMMTNIALPPRTGPVTTAPIPILAEGFERDSCTVAQRDAIWVANGWTLHAMNLWLRANLLPGYQIETFGAGGSHGGRVSVLYFGESPRSWHSNVVPSLNFTVVAIDEHTVGLHLEAVSPAAGTPCGVYA